MPTVKHWLYSSIEFNELITEETKCIRCLHLKVCGQVMRERCINYIFGTLSSPESCHSCIHHYTKWDEKQPIPCFKCPDFLLDENWTMKFCEKHKWKRPCPDCGE